jgi:GntR family transcriptional regulator, transcriptional repressor for pyruvate dehydrogenase complex
MVPRKRFAAHVRPVHSVTLSEQIANQIIDMVTAHRWKPGEKLPSEAELCEAFHVSRPTLREALKSLAFSGFVRMRAGEGTYVAENPPTMFGRIKKTRLKNQRDLWYVIETRFALETRVATLCAQRLTKEDLQKIESLVAEMQRRLDCGGDGFLEADIEFHLAIATASKNPFLSEFMHVLREPVLHLMYVLKRSGLARAQAEHLVILEALKQRDPGKARRAMEVHLRTYWRRGLVLFNGQGPHQSFGQTTGS